LHFSFELSSVLHQFGSVVIFRGTAHHGHHIGWPWCCDS